MTQPLRSIVLSVFTMAVIVASSADPLANGDRQRPDRGGKLTFTGGFGLDSPCLPETLNTNNVTVTATVSADVDKHHENVDVRVRFNGPASGNGGGTYNLSGAAHASYNTVNATYFTYKLPVRLDVDGVNGTPSFTAFLELGMFVGGNQQPVRLFFSGGEFVCEVP